MYKLEFSHVFVLFFICYAAYWVSCCISGKFVVAYTVVCAIQQMYRSQVCPGRVILVILAGHQMICAPESLSRKPDCGQKIAPLILSLFARAASSLGIPTMAPGTRK